MVRLSKQNQEKLEIIMNLVEQLGVDRVLTRLRQTKMMSKDVLEDMKEWETDYEKRVALMGFLVSPEGKKAFGALFELAKVHLEQIKLQEEQEKMRQEHLAKQKSSPDQKKSRSSRGLSTTAEIRATGGSNMKSKLKAQMNRRRALPSESSQQSNAQRCGKGNLSKSKSKDPTDKSEEKDDPLLEEAARTLQEAERQVKEKKRIDAFRHQLAANERLDPCSNAINSRRSSASSRLTASITEKVETSQTDSSKTKIIQTVEKEMPRVLEQESNTNAGVQEAEIVTEFEPISNVITVFTQSTEEVMQQNTVQTCEIVDVKEEHKEDTFTAPDITTIVPLSQNANIKNDSNKEKNLNLINPNNHLSYAGNGDTDEIAEPNEELQIRDDSASKELLTSTVSDILVQLFAGEIDVMKLQQSHIDEIVHEWRVLRRKREERMCGNDSKLSTILQLKEKIILNEEEKAEIQKEKDRIVFKEHQLQQKLQDLSQKHKILCEDHESLKQGNYQIQQNSKKVNKAHQEMKKKIAKLESKIKSMDKVTIRRGTQTEENLDKDVHEALRHTEESMLVTQSELNTTQAKLKSLQQEADELKKQVNIKGREINKRERKSKKDEDQIRLIARERDTTEVKLRKSAEQLEHYKGMIDSKVTGNSKRASQEKKEIKVERCASGRHVVVKAVASSGAASHNQHGRETEIDQEESLSQLRTSRPNSVKVNGKSTRQQTGEKKVNKRKKTVSFSDVKVEEFST